MDTGEGKKLLQKNYLFPILQLDSKTVDAISNPSLVLVSTTLSSLQYNNIIIPALVTYEDSVIKAKNVFSYKPVIENNF